MKKTRLINLISIILAVFITVILNPISAAASKDLPAVGTIAVITFETLPEEIQGNKWLGAGISENLSDRIAAARFPSMDVYSRRAMSRLMRQGGTVQAGTGAGAEIDKISLLMKPEGVDYLVVGSIQSPGDWDNPKTSFVLNAFVVSLDEEQRENGDHGLPGQVGEAISISHEYGLGGVGLFAAQTELAERVAETLKIGPSSGVPLSRSEVGNIAALKTYTEATVLFDEAAVLADAAEYGNAAETFDRAKIRFLKAYQDTGGDYHSALLMYEKSDEERIGYLQMSGSGVDLEVEILAGDEFLEELEKKQEQHLATIKFVRAQRAVWKQKLYFDSGDTASSRTQADRARQFLDQFDKVNRNRALIWKTAAEACNSVVDVISANGMFIIICDRMVYSLDPEKGHIVWQYSYPEEPSYGEVMGFSNGEAEWEEEDETYLDEEYEILDDEWEDEAWDEEVEEEIEEEWDDASLEYEEDDEEIEEEEEWEEEEWDDDDETLEDEEWDEEGLADSLMDEEDETMEASGQYGWEDSGMANPWGWGDEDIEEGAAARIDFHTAEDTVVIRVNDYIVAIDMQTGKEIWRRAFDEVFELINNTVYISYASVLYAVDTQSGREKWQYSMKRRYYKFYQNRNGIIYMLFYDSVRAIDQETGQVLWTAPLDPDNLIPLSMTDSGMYLFKEQSLTALNAKTGELQWTMPVEEAEDAHFIFSQQRVVYSVRSELLFLDASTGEMRHQVALDKNAIIENYHDVPGLGVAVVSSSDRETDNSDGYYKTTVYDYENAEILWEYDDWRDDVMIFDNTAIIFIDQKAVALDVATGRTKWEEPCSEKASKYGNMLISINEAGDFSFSNLPSKNYGGEFELYNADTGLLGRFKFESNSGFVSFAENASVAVFQNEELGIFSGYDLNSGENLWRYELDGEDASYLGIHQDTLIVTDNNFIYSIQLRHGGAEPTDNDADLLRIESCSYSGELLKAKQLAGEVLRRSPNYQPAMLALVNVCDALEDGPCATRTAYSYFQRFPYDMNTTFIQEIMTKYSPVTWISEGFYDLLADEIFVAHPIYEKSFFTAVDIDRGEMLWAFEPEKFALINNVISSKKYILTVAQAVMESEAYLYALDKWTGDIAWEFDVDDEISGYGQRTFLLHVSDDVLYIARADADLEKDTVLSAVDIHSGRILWETDMSWLDTGFVYHRNIVASSGNAEVLVNTAQGSLTKRDEFNGEIIWEAPYCCGKIYLDEGLVFSWDGQYVDGDWAGDRAYALNAETGETLWATKATRKFGKIKEIVVDGDVIVLEKESSLCVIERTSGELLWRMEEYYGDPFDVSEKTLFLSSNDFNSDKFYITAYDKFTGNQLWRNETGQQATWISASPETVYVGTIGPFHAFNTKKGSKLWEFPAGMDVPIMYRDKVFLALRHRGDQWRGHFVALDLKKVSSMLSQGIKWWEED